MTNLFTDLPAPGSSTEQFSELLARPGLRIERIVSTGQASPADFWYDQAEDEWVVLLSGAARLEFAAPARYVTLGPGDHLFIPAHCRHRVAWTDTEQVSVWLAIHHQPT